MAKEKEHKKDGKEPGAMNAMHPDLHHMELHPAENGGMVIHHIFHHKPSKSGAFMEMEEPEKHAFGPNEGHKMAEHLAEHVPMIAEHLKGEEPEEEEHEAMEEEPEGKEYA